MKDFNNATKDLLSNEQKVQQIIKYGVNPMDNEEADDVITNMAENGIKWDDLNIDTQKALGGELRFATRVLNNANELGADQKGRDDLVTHLGLRVQRETQPSFRWMYGLKNSLQEVKAGALNIFGEDKESKEDAKQSYIESQIRSNLYEAYSGSTDILTSVGESTPSMALGGGIGALTAPLKFGYAAITDLVTQGVLTSAEYQGATDHDRNAGIQAGTETAVNVASTLLGRWGSAVEKYTPVELENIAGQTKDVADQLGIKLFNMDGELTNKGITTFKDRISKLSVSEQKELGDETIDSMNKFLDYYDEASNNLVKVSGEASSVGSRLGDNVAESKEAWGQYVKALYKESDEVLTNSTSTISRDEVFNNIIRPLQDTRVDVREDIAGFIAKLYKDHDETLDPKELVDLIKIMGSKARDEGSKMGGATASKAYGDITNSLKDQLESLVPTKSLKNANKAYKDKLDIFGYSTTGKGAKADNFIPKFIKQLEANPAKSLNLINTPERLQIVKGLVSDESFASIGKNKLEDAITKATTNGEINLLKLSKELKAIPKDMLGGMFGENASKIKDIAELAEVLGKRRSAGKLVSDKNIAELFVNKNLRGSLGAWLPSRIAIEAALDVSKTKTLKEVLSDVFKINGQMKAQEAGKGLVDVPNKLMQEQFPSGSNEIPIF